MPIGPGSLITATQIETLIGLAKGSMSAMGWLVMQEMAKGATLALIGKQLGITESDLETMRDEITALIGDESKAKWQEGILTIKTATTINQTASEQTWDAVEALAINKLHSTLSNMVTNGNPTEMLAIAAAANKAVRRQRGEGMNQGAKISVDINTGITAELRSGDLGFIKLNLSPNIAKQLQDPGRVIDGETKRVSTIGSLKMLTLEETRLAGDTGGLDDKAKEDAKLRDMFPEFAK